MNPEIVIDAWDNRRNLLIPGDTQTTIKMCVFHFISTAQEAIAVHGNFYVALSGGSTPKAIYEYICSPLYAKQLDWSKVWLFWGDERNVAPTHQESNYKMAMEAGFHKMGIPPQQICRMEAEGNIEEKALQYEQKIQKILGNKPFDLVMLGMGEDGHTASLFPNTKGLTVRDKLVIANYVPQKNSWRMTLTFEAINKARNIVIYVIGSSKKEMLAHIFTSQEELYPIQKIGTTENKALWILDEAAAANLPKS